MWSCVSAKSTKTSYPDYPESVYPHWSSFSRSAYDFTWEFDSALFVIFFAVNFKGVLSELFTSDDSDFFK